MIAPAEATFRAKKNTPEPYDLNEESTLKFLYKRALAKGKKMHDKRETERERDALREAQHAMKKSRG